MDSQSFYKTNTRFGQNTTDSPSFWKPLARVQNELSELLNVRGWSKRTISTSTSLLHALRRLKQTLQTSGKANPRFVVIKMDSSIQTHLQASCSGKNVLMELQLASYTFLAVKTDFPTTPTRFTEVETDFPIFCKPPTRFRELKRSVRASTSSLYIFQSSKPTLRASRRPTHALQ